MVPGEWHNRGQRGTCQGVRSHAVPVALVVLRQVRRAESARSYEGMEHVANPNAVRRSWPRWSSTGYSMTWSA